VADLIPVGPGVPPEMAAVLKSHEDALRELQNPGSPVQLPEIATEADLLSQAPAADHPNRAIVVTDLNCIAVSTDVAGTWTWLRSDGSAL
jgi:hypothetical protein